MRLTDLDPHWFTLAGWASQSPFRIGITFLCPHCRTERLGVLFDPPSDPDGVQAATGFTYSAQGYAGPERHVWKREGDTFDTLTLSPSIDASEHGHWHGFITNGEIR